jgi:hypothetical protein
MNKWYDKQQAWRLLAFETSAAKIHIINAWV